MRFSPGCCCESSSGGCCPGGGKPFDPPKAPPLTLYATLGTTHDLSTPGGVCSCAGGVVVTLAYLGSGTIDGTTLDQVWHGSATLTSCTGSLTIYVTIGYLEDEQGSCCWYGATSCDPDYPYGELSPLSGRPCLNHGVPFFSDGLVDADNCDPFYMTMFVIHPSEGDYLAGCGCNDFTSPDASSDWFYLVVTE